MAPSPRGLEVKQSVIGAGKVLLIRIPHGMTGVEMLKALGKMPRKYGRNFSRLVVKPEANKRQT